MVSNFNDIESAKECLGTSDVQLPLTTTSAIQFMTSESYVLQYSITQENNLFDGLCNYFTMYEVPIGLISRLLEIRHYRLNFMIDDSGWKKINFYSLVIISLIPHYSLFLLFLIVICF